MSTHFKAILGLCAAVLIWSISPSIVRAFALETGAGDAMVIRMVTNCIFCIPLLLWVGPKFDWEDLPRYLLVGIVGNFGYYVGSNFGFANLSAGAGGMIYATNPLMIAALAAALGVERLSLPVILGLLISFAGTCYLFADGLSGTGQSPIFGGFMMLFGCACWAVYVVFARPLIRKYGPVKVTLWTTAMCILPALGFLSGTTLNTAMHLSHQAIFSLLFMTLIATLLSVNFWNYAAAVLPPSSVGASLYVIPPCIALIGWLFFNEATGAKTLLAGLIILAGVAVAEFGKTFLSKPQPAT
nr:EamA family transporter [Aestuariivirga litoralis]